MIYDYIIGLHCGFENKIDYLLNYYDTHIYDFCIKYECECLKSFYYKNDSLLFYKYIPLCIFNNIPFIIGEQSIINVDELKLEINQYMNINIDIENMLYISKNAIINYNDILYKIDEIENDQLAIIFDSFFPKIVDFNSILENKPMLIFESSKGVYDVNNEKFNKKSSSISTLNVFSLKNVKFCNNIIGIANIFETYNNFNLVNEQQLFNVNYIYERNNSESNIKNTISKNYNWLNLDKLINTIKNTGTNIVIIVGSKLLTNIDKIKLFYNSKYIEFSNIHNYKLFIETKIRIKLDVTEINFV